MTDANLDVDQSGIFNTNLAEEAEAKEERWAEARRAEAEEGMRKTAARVAERTGEQKKRWAAAAPGMIARQEKRMRW